MIVGLFIICVSILVFFYFFIFEKGSSRLQAVESELHMEQKLVQAYETKSNAGEGQTFLDSTSLQKRIPVQPLTDQLLLDIERAEVISGSSIQTVSFEKMDSAYRTEQKENDPTDEGNTASNETSKVETIEGSSGLKRIQFTMTVQSPTYFEMESFLKELENLNRLVEVNQLNFTGTEELIESKEEESDQLITYEVVASAFYLPELTELLESLPKIETPTPSLKKNPFNQYTDPNVIEKTTQNQ